MKFVGKPMTFLQEMAGQAASLFDMRSTKNSAVPMAVTVDVVGMCLQ
jgi:hypothetical protein